MLTRTISNLKLLFSDCKMYWHLFAVATIATVLASSAEAGLYKYLIPQVLNEGIVAKTPEALKAIPLLLLACFMAKGVGEFLGKYSMGYLGSHYIKRQRQDILTKMLYLPEDFFQNTSPGELLVKINYDTEQIAMAVRESVLELFKDIITVIALVVVLFSFSAKLALSALLLLPLVVLNLKMLGSRIRRYSRKLQDSVSSINNTATDVIVNHKTIKSFLGQQSEINKIKKTMQYNFKQELKIVLLQAISDPVMQAIAALALAFLLYQSISYKISLDAGSFVGFFGAMFALIRPMKRITNTNSTINKGVVSKHAIMKLLEQEVEQDFGKISKIDNIKSLNFAIKNFSYPSGKGNAVENINFSCQRGEVTALVGKSGSGKSSLISLLMRFYQDYNGNILLNNIDSRELTLSCLRRQVAIVPQQFNLFRTSIRNNIAYGLTDVSSKEVEAALAKACALDFVSKKGGMDFVLDDAGDELSGGQKQRLAIARALLRKSPIIVLDEATSALDNESEQAIQQVMQDIKAEVIFLVIAHRLSTIKLADQIIVMEQGQIQEIGKHDSLIAKDGRYASLYNEVAMPC